MTSVDTIQKAGTGWQEAYLGGSKAAEDEMVRRFATAINRIQRDIRRIEGSSRFERAQHGNMLAGTKNARFEVPRSGAPVEVPRSGAPEDLQVGIFRPGKTYTAHVRFSNASSIEQADSVPDLRGAAVRVLDDNGEAHDFLMTNAPFSHARDARQFMTIASAVVRIGRPAALWKVRAWRTAVGLARIARRLGMKEAVRVLRTISAQTSRPVSSLATERYWSRAPFAFGPVAVKFMLEPTEHGSNQAAPDLRKELAARLRAGDVTFDFRVQRYVDAAKTPIEDGTVEWKEEDAPFVTIARLIIPQQELDPTAEAEIDTYAFNPWNGASDDYRPLGSMNRARRAVYSASAKLRGAG